MWVVGCEDCVYNYDDNGNYIDCQIRRKELNGPIGDCINRDFFEKIVDYWEIT